MRIVDVHSYALSVPLPTGFHFSQPGTVTRQSTLLVEVVTEYAHRHPGLVGIGIAIATVSAALTGALTVLEASTSQQLINLRGVDPTPASRLRITGPAKTPPKFWPT